MNRTDIEFHRAQSRLKSNSPASGAWRQKVVASLFPRRTGATPSEPVIKPLVTNNDRMAAYEKRRAALEARGKALASQWEHDDERIIKAITRALREVA